MSAAAIEAFGIFVCIAAAVLFGVGVIAGALTPREDLHRVRRDDEEDAA